ncbi:erythroferrone-like isoform X1 [Bufo bufo]|uniref:erythroferrone-like isoform X1 n=1 Tax=Bufo bufo TaxID=8384 RepID=UPI001ABE5839|nr:erythroferrone-like isoform X1 [Bufo bufo]
MNADSKPVPLRCVLMTISMGVLLILLSACPACTHKNRGSKFEDASITVLPSVGIPVLTPPEQIDTTVEKLLRKGTGAQATKYSPKNSWLFFLKHSDRDAKNKKKGHEDSLRNHHSGPIGPPAPSRHHSHSINHVSRQKKLSQFLQLMSDVLLKQKDGEQSLAPVTIPTVLPTKVHAAFTCKTIGDIQVESGEMKELQNYQRHLLEGSFYRGAGLNSTSGRYTAPVTGLYAFFARLQIDFQKPAQHWDTPGFLCVQLCILSLCQEKLSLQQIGAFTSSEVAATITLNGVLYIQAGEYVSLFLENRIKSWLVLEKGSDFSGVLLGQ